MGFGLKVESPGVLGVLWVSGSIGVLWSFTRIYIGFRGLGFRGVQGLRFRL